MKYTLLSLILFSGLHSFSQNGWGVCNAPVFGSRVDDIFMPTPQVGYAVCGDGQIVKTINGGNNWTKVFQNANTYFRSVEFINEQKGFAGGFPRSFSPTAQVFYRTIDGGATWNDITASIPLKARKGICGLAIPDANTIYGGGNWYQDSGYIIKSTDGGTTWNLIDMSAFATSIIDLHFLNKDTGFATGKGIKPAEAAVILYTTNGGASWTKKFTGSASEYCWKIQRLTKLIYYASIEDLANAPAKVLRSVDGGMTWKVLQVTPKFYNIEGIGFINPLHGWTGGDVNKSFETRDGGATWDSIPVCPYMNRVLRVNDTTILATGMQIWKYNTKSLYPVIPETRFVSLNCTPNPVQGTLTINVATTVATHVSVLLLDNLGRKVKEIDNTDRAKGSYQFYVNTASLQAGVYYVTLKTHEDKEIKKIVVTK